MDLFVNYDCSLQAANLYERTVKAVRRLMQLAEPNPLFSAAVTQVRAGQPLAAQHGYLQCRATAGSTAPGQRRQLGNRRRSACTQQAQRKQAQPRQQACVLFGVCCLQ